MPVQTVDQTQRDPASTNLPANGPDRPVTEAFDAAVAQANKASAANPAATPAPTTRAAGAERPTAQPSNGATPSLAEQRRRALDQSLRSMKETQARIKQELAPLTSDQSTYLGSDVKDMVASIDQKIADFDAHRKGAISDPQQMDAQIARAKAIQKEMQSLPTRVQTRAREFVERAANTYDQAVRSGLNTTSGILASQQQQDWLSRHWFQKESIERGKEQVRVLAEMVSNLDAKKQAFLDAKKRGAPQAEIDKALVAYYSETVKAFNYDAQSGQEQLAAIQKGIHKTEQALAVTRVVRDGSFTVAAMLIPGAQGVGVGSGLATVAALGLMKTGTHLADEKPGGGSRTPGSVAEELATNTAGLGVDAASGLGYLKLGKGMLGATSMLQKASLIGAAGGVSATSGTAHRLIDGKETDGKKAAFEFATGAITFGGTSKLAGLMPNMNRLPRLTLNAGIGAGTSVAVGAAEQRLDGNGIDGAGLLGVGLVGLGSGIAMTPRKANALSEPGPAPETKAPETKAPETKAPGPAPEPANAKAPQPVNAKAPQPAMTQAPPAIAASPAELANKPSGSTSTITKSTTDAPQGAGASGGAAAARSNNTAGLNPPDGAHQTTGGDATPPKGSNTRSGHGDAIMEYRAPDGAPDPNAVRQTDRFRDAGEIRERLDDGFQRVSGEERGRRLDGRLSVVLDRTQDHVLRQTIDEAHARFDKFKGDPLRLAKELAIFSKEKMHPKGWTEDMVDESHALFTKQNAGKRILLGDYIRRAANGTGAGVCAHQALLFKALADDFGLDATLVRGVYSNESVPPASLAADEHSNHAWNLVHIDGKTYVFDPRNQLYAMPETELPEYISNRFREGNTGPLKFAAAGVKPGDEVTYKGSPGWRVSDEPSEQPGKIVLRHDGAKDISEAKFFEANPGRGRPKVGEKYEIVRSNKDHELGWTYQGKTRDGSLRFIKKDAVREEVDPDQLQGPNVNRAAEVPFERGKVPAGSQVQYRGEEFTLMQYDNITGKAILFQKGRGKDWAKVYDNLTEAELKAKYNKIVVDGQTKWIDKKRASIYFAADMGNGKFLVAPDSQYVMWDEALEPGALRMRR